MEMGPESHFWCCSQWTVLFLGVLFFFPTRITEPNLPKCSHEWIAAGLFQSFSESQTRLSAGHWDYPASSCASHFSKLWHQFCATPLQSSGFWMWTVPPTSGGFAVFAQWQHQHMKLKPRTANNYEINYELLPKCVMQLASTALPGSPLTSVPLIMS